MDDDAEVHPAKGRNRAARMTWMRSGNWRQEGRRPSYPSLRISMESGARVENQTSHRNGSLALFRHSHMKRGQFFLSVRGAVDSHRHPCMMTDHRQASGANSP